MNKVVAINLNGRAYQVEEAGYTALKQYMHDAAERLADDPDKEEIVADLEQAVAEKCDQVLVKGKTVVSEKEILKIIEQMGPVGTDKAQDEAGKEKSSDSADAKGSDRRFYLIKEGSYIGGVATGLSAFFNLDVTVIRLMLVILAFLTHGFAVGAYIIAMIVAPVANTPEKRAKARGQGFNSQALIEAAREKYSELSRDGRPAFGGLGDAIRAFLRIIAGFVAGLGFVVVMAAVIAGLGLVWSFVMAGAPLEMAVGGGAAAWLVGLFAACGLAVGLIPVLVISILCYQYAKTGHPKAHVWVLIAASVVFSAAVSLFVALPSNSPELRQTIHHFVDKAQVNSLDQSYLQ